MTLHFLNEQSAELPFAPEALAMRVLETALKREGWPSDVSVSLLLVDDEGIASLNREFRDTEGPTDVLSFPGLDLSAPADPSAITRDAGNTDPESGELLLGDIVISVERAKAQAAAYGHSCEREVAFLIAHSALHLLGYDHMEEEEAAAMERKQEEILTELGITRGTEDAEHRH